MNYLTIPFDVLRIFLPVFVMREDPSIIIMCKKCCTEGYISGMRKCSFGLINSLSDCLEKSAVR